MNLTKSELRQLIKESLIIESSKKKFNKLIEQGKIPEEDFNQMWNGKRNKFNPPFNDDLYRMIVYNTYAAEQNHSIDDFKNNYEYIKQKVLSPFASSGRALAPVTVPGIGIFDVSKSLNDKTTTYDEIMVNAEDKDSVSVKKSNVLQEIIDDAVAGKPNQHLELIYKDNKWIFLYPKSYKGSIAVSRMGGDLKYYGNATSQNSSIGRIPWCIAPDSVGNMFLNYHRRMNLHMYIGTKLGNSYRNNDKNRKVCLSFLKKHGYVDLASGNSTVNARNNDLSQNEAKLIVGAGILSALEKDAKRPERLEIDEISYYKSVNVPQYQNIEAATDTNNDNDFQRFLQESGSMARHTENVELLKYIYLKYGVTSSKSEEYVDEWGATVNSQTKVLLEIEKNPLFNTSFLKSLDMEIRRLPPRHAMMVDPRFIESVCTRAMNKITGKYQDQKTEASATLETLSKMQVSTTTSRKFQDRLALKLVELFSGGGDYYHRNYILNFLNFDKAFADLVFSKLNKEKIKKIIDSGSRYNITQLVKHPRVYGILYDNTQEVYSEYITAYKEELRELRKGTKKRPEPHRDPRVTASPVIFIPPEEIVKIIDNEQGYTERFIVACINQYISHNYNDNINLSDQEVTYVKNRILEFYYSQGKAIKKIMLKTMNVDNLIKLDADEIANLIYELHKNDIEGYLKFGHTSYDGAILQYPQEDKNMYFI